MQKNTKTSAETTKHPSGLTWERWNQPFKMPHERKQIQEWLARRNGSFLNDGSTPF